MARERLAIAMTGTRGVPATYGGIEMAVEALSVELAKRGHDVTVYVRNAYAETREPEYRGVKLRYLPQVNTKHLEAATHTVASLADVIRSRRFDVVHIHATGPALFSFLPRMARIPTVATVHALDWRREKWGPMASRVLRIGVHAAAKVPNRTIVVSQELERHLRDDYGADPIYIPNGVDPAQFEEASPVEGLEPGRFALFLGRLVPEKGVHTLIRAYMRTDLEEKLAIAGPVSHTGEYVSEVTELAAGDPRIDMIGPRYGAEKAWLLRNAAVFVLPSTLEGLPIALMEAAACGCRSVVSDIPENLEVVSPNGHPLAVAFRTEDENDLAVKLVEAIRDPEREAKAAEARTKILERYDWARIAEQTERVYLRAIGR
jgi:glycosyltransferase involved in cell wall biosynthesis